MKTDAQILTEAIEKLEGEDAWCQGVFYRTNDDGVRISFCAEGAILEAAGLWDFSEQTAEVSWDGSPSVGWTVVDPQMQKLADAIFDQCGGIYDKVMAAADAEFRCGLPTFNDAPDRTAGDVILAMKKALALEEQ